MSSVFGASSSGEPVGGSARRRRCRPRRGPSRERRRRRPPRRRRRRGRRSGGSRRASSGRAPPGRSRPLVARVSGTWTVTTSDRARSVVERTSSTPWWAACSAVTYGSAPRTVISIARARAAIAWPILPSPTIPSVWPRSSRPVNWDALPLAAPHRGVGGGDLAGDAVEQRERVLGGGDRVAGRGVDDVMPARVAASRSTLSTPTPARPMTCSRARGDDAGVDLDLAADDQRVVVGEERAQSSSRVRPGRSSTSCCARRRATPSGAMGSATRILTPGRRLRCR